MSSTGQLFREGDRDERVPERNAVDAIDFIGQVNFAIGALQAVKDEATNGLTANGEWMAKCLTTAMQRSAEAIRLLEGTG